MDLVFSYKYINLLLLLLGSIIIIYFLSKRFAKKRTLRFGNFEVLEKVTERGFLPGALLPLVFRILAITLIVMALSEVEFTQEEYVAKTDFVLAIDTSSSMLTPDYEPNRLELAKKSAIEWVGKLKNTKVGIVTFAGRSYLKIEPTSNLGKVKDILEKISFEKPAGTAIGEALITGSALLQGSERNKTIILITDGRNNVGVSINESLKPLKTEGIKVHAIGIGSKENKSIFIPEELKEKNVTATGFPELDEETLKFLANETDGKYVYIDDSETFRKAFESEVEFKKTSISVFSYLLLFACVILLADWFLEITRYRPLP
jgi:Ca-activated chloride channel family protein